MKVLLTGGTGFIGRHVVAALVARGHRCVVVSRGSTNPFASDAVEVLRADPTRPGPWQTAVGTSDAVINLAGAPLVDPPHRWTATRKLRIRESRIETTRGDRLFITLLGSAFINLAWLGVVGAGQPYALIVCLIYAAAVFRWV